MATASVTNDLKMIDSEMQAILAELLMPAPQSAVQPEVVTRLPFSVLPENAVLAEQVYVQPQILPTTPVQTPGTLSSSVFVAHYLVSRFSFIFFCFSYSYVWQTKLASSLVNFWAQNKFFL